MGKTVILLKNNLTPFASPSEADPSLQRDLNVDPTLCPLHSVTLNFIYDQTSQGDLDSTFRGRGHHRFSTMHQRRSTKCLMWKFESHERSLSHRLNYNFWKTPRDPKMWRRVVSASHFTFAHKSIANNKVFYIYFHLLSQPLMGGCCQFIDCYFLWTHVFWEARNVLTPIQFLPGTTYFVDVFWIFIRRIILPLYAENGYLTQLLWSWKRLKSFSFYLSELGSLSCILGSFWLVWIPYYLILSRHRFPWRKNLLQLRTGKRSLSFLDYVWHKNISSYVELKLLQYWFLQV